jgi:uncharacterized repeat protein (TIGR02543 family)
MQTLSNNVDNINLLWRQKMNKRLFPLLLAVMIGSFAVLAGGVTAYASVTDLGSNTGWVTAYPSNNQNDYLTDQQTGSGSVSQDIVGDSNNPAVYMHLDPSMLSFRIRLNDIDGTDPYEFKNFAFVGVDADVNGSVDFFMGVYNPTGNNGRVGIYSAASGYANISPSTTGISGKPLLAFKPLPGVNYAITPAGSDFGRTADYFVSFGFSVADVERALAGTGYSFSASTPFRFITGTAAQDNSFNQDINGMDKSGWSSGSTWSTLGVFNDIVTADGSSAYYSVTFDKNTGDTEASPAVIAVRAGQPLGSLPAQNPLKRGMYFQEWNTRPDGTGEKISADTVVNGNMTVYAVWSSNAVCTVTFNPNGGNFGGSVNPVTVPTINGSVGDNMPPDPIQSNKFFTGWLIDGTSNFVNSATPITSDTIVNAQWANTANNTAVFYDNFTASGGSVIARVYSNGNSNNFNGNLPSVTRPGYTFGGWYFDDPACAGAAVTKINSPGNYYAKWTPAAYMVTFDQNYAGAPAAETKQITGGLLGDLPADPSRSEYRFIEWNRDPLGTGEAMYPSTVISSNTTVHAIWDPMLYINFNANGGEFYGGSTQWSTDVIGGMPEILPQPPFRGGYTFSGWGITAESRDAVGLQDIFGIDSLYAIWSPVKTVTFNENYGADPASVEVMTAYGSVLYIPEDPVRTNYSFGGWNTEANGKGAEFTLSTSVKNDMTVFALWESVSQPFTVSFVTNGGSTIPGATVSEIAETPVSAKDGYSLEGWYTDPELNNKVSFPYAVAQDTVLYAGWTANSYSVTLVPGSGSGGTAGVAVSYGQPMPAASAPKRTGHTFEGYFDTDGKQYYGSNMESASVWDKTEDAALYAGWSPNSYSVFFEANGGQFGSGDKSAAIQQEYGSAYVLPEEPVRDGYTFGGWNTQPDGSGDSITGTTAVTVTESRPVYAVWTELGHVMIRYASNNTDFGSVSRAGESLNPETGTALGSTAFPGPGCEFTGWLDESGSTVCLSAEFVPSKGPDGLYSAAVYTAEFRESVYPVTINVNTDGAAAAGRTVRLTGEGSIFFTLTEQADHSYTGSLPGGTYTVWIDDADTRLTVTAASGEAPAEINYYSLTLVKGTGILEVSGLGIFLEGSTVPGISAQTDAGYVWSRWVSGNADLIADITGQHVSFKMPSGPVTLTAFAVRVPVTYVITAAAGANGSVSPSGPVEVASGSDQSFTIKPEAGYHIKEVYVDGASVGNVSGYTFTGVSRDHTVSATFERNSTRPKTYTVMAAAGAGGTVTPGGMVTVNGGSSLTVLMTAEKGFTLLDVIVDGKSIGAVSSFTFTNISGSHTVSAVFAHMGDIPKTSDETPAAAILIMTAAALAGSVILTAARNKKLR